MTDRVKFISNGSLQALNDKMSDVLSLVLLLGSMGAAASTSDSRHFPVSDAPELGDPYPERINHFANGVVGFADVVYSRIPGYRPLVLDIYQPKHDGTSKPLVLYIHGGGWFTGHTRHLGALTNLPALLADLASEGFVVASLEYRLSGETPFPAALQDAQSALRFLKTNAAKYRVDPTRSGIWGASAGGHLAALTALTCSDPSFNPAPIPGGLKCVQAAVTWYGIFDFSPIVTTAVKDTSSPKPVFKFLGCRAEDCTSEIIDEASPISHVSAKAPPFLLLHGEADAVVAVEQSRNFEARLMAAGVPVDSVYFEAVGHSWIGATSDDTRAATVRAANATFEFFRAILHGEPKQ